MLERVHSSSCFAAFRTTPPPPPNRGGERVFHNSLALHVLAHTRITTHGVWPDYRTGERERAASDFPVTYGAAGRRVCVCVCYPPQHCYIHIGRGQYRHSPQTLPTFVSHTRKPRKTLFYCDAGTAASHIRQYDERNKRYFFFYY